MFSFLVIGHAVGKGRPRSGAVSHAFAGPTSACGPYLRRDTRPRLAREHYCQRCKAIVEGREAKERAAKAQGRLPW